jgi:hypothetical protein
MLNSSLRINKSYQVIYILFFRICIYLGNIIKYSLTEFWAYVSYRNRDFYIQTGCIEQHTKKSYPVILNRKIKYKINLFITGFFRKNGI